jgi:hypothetical protein
MLAALRIDETERADTPVVCAAVPGSADAIPSAAGQAWRQLEAKVPIRGRKAFGYWDPPTLTYRACFSLADGDNAEGWGLERAVLPGGRYRRARLEGDDLYAQIGPAFERFVEGADIDATRPWLEFYRRHDEVDVLVPIRT